MIQRAEDDLVRVNVQLLHPLAVGGLLTGLAVMYATGLLVAV